MAVTTNVGDTGHVDTDDLSEADLLSGASRSQKRRARRVAGKLSDYPHLLAMKPREKYLFRSDYFQVDDTYACVLGFFHDDAARDDFSAFWGINRIPSDLGPGVSTVVLEQVRRLGEKWVDDKMKSSETIGNLTEREQSNNGASVMNRRKADKSRQDLETVVAEIQDGASYLHVHNRLLVKAPSLEALETALEKIGRLYVDRFATLRVAAYPGEQHRELSTVLRSNEEKRGPGFHYTSTEFAGSHSLVTNGLNDVNGEYVGYMVGDVNNSAVLLDVDDYKRRVVVASNAVNTVLGRTPEADLWGSKLSQAALLNNRRVVHLVLDGCNLDILGPKFDNLTARLDMSRGDVNMLELFGERKHEIEVFGAHLDKIVLMVDQAYESGPNEQAVIRGSLREILTQFYVDKQMWYRNAPLNRDRLRVVGIPHKQVPRLQDVVTYFDTAYQTLAKSTARDEAQLHAYSVLRLVFRDLLDTNGDLFNAHTSDQIDGVGSARRVIYDFSDLMRRGTGIAMAQLVNTVGFAVGSLDADDVVVIHGTELIDERVNKYVTNQLQQLFRRGGRAVLLYNSIEAMIEGKKFNQFDDADYTVLGAMRPTTVTDYQESLNQMIPPDLEKLITTSGGGASYLRRGHVNVVFQTDLALGVNPARAKRREQLKREMPAIRPQNGSQATTRGTR